MDRNQILQLYYDLMNAHSRVHRLGAPDSILNHVRDAALELAKHYNLTGDEIQSGNA